MSDEDIPKVDFDFVRSKMYEAAEMADEATRAALDLAKGAEHPRAFEAFSQILAAYKDTLNDIYDLSKKRQNLEKPSAIGGVLPGSISQTNNNVFIGTTKEMSDYIENELAKKRSVIEGEVIDEDEEDKDDKGSEDVI